MANLFSTPENFGVGGSWSNARCSVIVNQIAAPDGTMTADELRMDSSAASTHGISQAITTSIGTQYAIGPFVKYKDWEWMAIYFAGGGSNNEVVHFNILTGEFGDVINSPDDYGVVDYGDGWFRPYMVTTAPDTTDGVSFFFSLGGTSLTLDGDNSSAFYIWGGYANAGTSLETYVSEAGITVTSSTPRLIRGVTRNITRNITKNLIDF